MAEFDIDGILLEVSWRLSSGIIDFDSNESINLLRHILMEKKYNSEFVDDYIYRLNNKSITEAEDTLGGDMTDIKDVLADVIEDYTKIMKVFYYFDPKSLGTISEVVLTQLLNQYSGTKSFPYLASHLGGGNKLTDIAIKQLDSKEDVMQISLKTSLDNEARIGLGYSDYVRELDWHQYFKNVEELQIFVEKNIIGNSINYIESKYEKKYPDLIEFFVSRVDGIIYKLSHIAFFWSAINAKKPKGSDTKVLNGFTFVVGNFGVTALTTTLKDKCKIYTGDKPLTGIFTSFSWGLELDGKKVIATEQSKNSSKYLNIGSIYLRDTFIKNKGGIKKPATGKIEVDTITDKELGKFHVIKANLDMNAETLKNVNIDGDIKKNLIQILLKNIDKL